MPNRWAWNVGQSEIDFGANLTGGAGRASAPRADFDTGAALLYSFLYISARSEFARAVALAVPADFVLARWGVVMSCMQPEWLSTDLHDPTCHQAAAALNSSLAHTTMSAEERAFSTAALEAYHGAGAGTAGAEQRWSSYAERMAKVAAWGDGGIHLEARGQVALGLLAIIDPGQWAADARGRAAVLWDPASPSVSTLAAANLEAMLHASPRHPHAVHLRIHQLDAPATAVSDEAFRLGTLYPQIAPSAFHAQHMPSHLMLRRGEWAAVQARNHVATQTSQAYINATGADPRLFFDSHSAQFEQYALLQLGRYAEAAALVRREVELGHSFRVAQMAALALIEPRGAWQRREELPPLVSCDTCDDPRNTDDLYLLSRQANAALLWAAALAAVRLNDSEAFAANHSRLASMRDETQPTLPTFSAFLGSAVRQLDAQLASAAASHDGARAAAREAVAMQRALGVPAYGWPLLWPAEETAAQVYLAAGDARSALQLMGGAWAGQHANRTRFVWLEARCLDAAGETGPACAAYERLAAALASGDDGAGSIRRAAGEWLGAHMDACRKLPAGEGGGLGAGAIAGILAAAVAALAGVVLLVDVGAARGKRSSSPAPTASHSTSKPNKLFLVTESSQEI